MQHITRVAILLTGLLTGLLTHALPAHAIGIRFDPLTSTTPPGSTVAVDVVVSGLLDPGAVGSREIVSAFDLDVLFDDSILAFDRLVFGDALGSADFDALTSFAAAPGRVDLASVSLLANADLLATQGERLVLASLYFDAVAPGTSVLRFDPTAPGGVDLVGLDPFTTLTLDSLGSAEIVVQRAQDVPEPGSLALFGLALAGVGLFRTSASRAGRAP